MKINRVLISIVMVLGCLAASLRPVLAAVDPAPSPAVEQDHILIQADADSLRVFTHSGAIVTVHSNTVTNVDAGNGKTLEISFDPVAGVIKIKNLCGSTGPVYAEVLDIKATIDSCKEKNINLTTASEGPQIPDTKIEEGHRENPDEGREPMSKIY